MSASVTWLSNSLGVPSLQNYMFFACMEIIKIHNDDEDDEDNYGGGGVLHILQSLIYHNHHCSSMRWKLSLSPLYRHGN